VIGVLHAVFGAGRRERLLCVAHHLVVDAVSWRILLSDLELAYAALARGERPQLPSATLAYADWARASSAALGVPEAPTALPRGSWGREGDAVASVEAFSAAETRALLEAAALQRCGVEELLLAALALAHREHSPEPLAVELESHGRHVLEQLDVSRSVGWFTALHGACLRVEPGLAAGEQLASVGAQIAAARRGASQASTASKLSFNYLGAWDDVLQQSSLLAALGAGAGSERDPAAERSYELEVDAVVVERALRVTFSHGGDGVAQAAAAQLRQSFRQQLLGLVARARSERRALRPCDVPLVALSDAELDALLAGRPCVVDIYPVSPVQQGMLFHSLWEPGSGAYVEQITCRLLGELDTQRLQRAWQLAVDRHPVLRTCFVWQNVRAPLQLVERQRELTLEQHELGALSSEEREQRLDALLEADRARGFDLANGPLLRVSLLRLGPEEHILLWSHHHIILDGWSCALLLQEVFRAYRIQSADGAALSEDLPERVPYREHVAWLERRRNQAATGSDESSEHFFRRMLGAFSEPTALPFERARRRSELRGHGVETRRLSAALTQRLDEFARERRVTLSTLLAGAWACVLGRAARQEQVLFGITVSGRSAPLPGVHEMVGLFINTLPLGVPLPPAARVSEWLAQLLERTSELGAHEHAELARLRASSAIPAGQPLFESLFVFENYPSDARVYQSVAGLAVRDVSFLDQTNYALTLCAQPGAELELRMAYDRQRFAAADAALLLGLVENLLEQFQARPDALLGQLALEPAGAQRARLESENQTAFAHAEPRHVPALIAARARQTPDAIALYFEERSLSYAALDARANQVAHALRARGVGPESLVAIAMERSLELVVGLLGILKAGAAYVPVDPEYPEERISYVLQDARASALLSLWPVASRLPACDAQLLCLDVDRAEIDRQPAHDPGVSVHGDNLAYTIYTSGSTGRPKGAGNTHDGLRNRLLWMQRHFGLQPTDRVLQKTPMSFDVSVWEFFWPLCVGAGLVLARPGDHRDGERLIELIERRAVTTLHFVPPMLQAFLELVDAPARGRLASLRRIICSGEALGAELARRCLELLPAELHNLYGPTEASIDVTAWQCLPGDRSASVPIGLPIDNTQIYVLDACGHPVPRGMLGELYIGGVGLARGYHSRPALTAERFVASAVGSVHGARLYRSGDLARQREDGAIEFVGRVDHQVKIRGFRIELGEIEARLLQHAAVREAVVVARDVAGERAGAKQLVAYVVLAGALEASQPAASQLQAWCGQSLPAYMLPAAIVLLERLPLSPNGKLDRRALPSPEASRTRREHVPPRTPAEQALAQIWSDVLQQPEVGAQDDFFELGGDSITSLQVIARASGRGLRLTPKQIFEHPRLQALALAAEPLQQARDGEGRSPVGDTLSQPSSQPEPPAPQAQLSADEWQDLISELES
jgi:amino acid adenylation domain-containing protein/non-ribosomal peptide synthase protein (TIGR01720 family)